MELLRFATAGSVDDGKSTLIGRLLYDTRSIMEDQLASVERTSQARGDEYVDLALLTDGLRAECEQGITIDVAYRYFSTPRRKFIIADTPGHVQYTRNMVTGASTADLALVLVDARKGLVEQTRRHASIASLLRVPHVVLCVNKMDLVSHDASVFRALEEDFRRFCAPLEFEHLSVIPVSALQGDNVVTRSERMGWYQGPALLQHLEEARVAPRQAPTAVRLPVQYVVRPQSVRHADYRAYAGQLLGGVLRPGDTLRVLPSGLTSRVRAIELAGRPLQQATAPQSVSVLLSDELDISRGDMLVSDGEPPTVSQTLQAQVCWMVERALEPGMKLLLKHTTRTVRAQVKALAYRLDVNTLGRDEQASSLRLNEMGRVVLRTSAPLFFDAYRRNRHTGSFILIDEATHATVGAGMIEGSVAE